MQNLEKRSVVVQVALWLILKSIANAWVRNAFAVIAKMSILTNIFRLTQSSRVKKYFLAKFEYLFKKNWNRGPLNFNNSNNVDTVIFFTALASLRYLSLTDGVKIQLMNFMTEKVVTKRIFCKTLSICILLKSLCVLASHWVLTFLCLLTVTKKVLETCKMIWKLCQSP